ncbi:hypothetical protein [Acidithiobacillus sp.]
MKHLNEEWRDLLGKLESEKQHLEKYIQTPKGAEEAVVWLVVMFTFCGMNAIWALWNLWHILLSAIW